MNDGDVSYQRNLDPYRALGVRPFINLCSVRTLHGGSLMLPQVRAAMAQASQEFVNLDELMEAAGARLAELTGAEWGIVTCGSAAALALAAAACVAGNDPVRMLRLPFTEGWVNRVLIAGDQRFNYDQAIRMVGTHMIEVNSAAELDAALAEPVAMMVVLGKNEGTSPVSLEMMVERARPRGIPVLVDAASEHLRRPSPWLERGADLVVYSGGKFLRGPQTSGLLLGNKRLVQAAWRNASPHQAFGRPMKVSKEDIVGVLAAVEHWFEQRDEAAEMRRWRDDLARIAAEVTSVPGVETRVNEPHGVVCVPTLTITWDPQHLALDGEALRLRLLANEPRVMLDDTSATERSVTLDPFGLQPGQAAQVGGAIAAVLRAAERSRAPEPAPALDLSGKWEARVAFLHGERTHVLQLAQTGGALTGTHHSPQFEGALTGSVAGNDVRLVLRAMFEGSIVSYALHGTAQADGTLSGEVLLGAGNADHHGPLGFAQFGSGAWHAARVEGG